MCCRNSGKRSWEEFRNVSFPRAAISQPGPAHPRPPLGPALGPPNPAPLAAAGTRQLLITTTFPTPPPHGNSSVFHPNKPSPRPGSEREQLAQREQVDLEAARRNSIISPANKPQPRQSWDSGCGWGATAAPEQRQRCEFVQAKPF